MAIEERRRILGERLRGARLKASGQRKRALALYLTQGSVAKRHKPLTQAFVAEQFGISQSYLSKVENGEQEPGFLLVEGLAAYYGSKVQTFRTYTLDEWRAGHHVNDL
jgi:transcriptional regulator with XRE-family HTH domain